MRHLPRIQPFLLTRNTRLKHSLNSSKNNNSNLASSKTLVVMARHMLPTRNRLVLRLRALTSNGRHLELKSQRLG
jgi:hypothetical protein